MPTPRYQDAHRDMQRRFDRLTSRAPVSRVEDLYDREVGSIIRSVNRGVRERGASSSPLTYNGQRQMAAQVRASLTDHARALAAELEDAQVEAHADSVRGLASFVEKMEGRRVPIDSPTSLRTLLAQRREELEETTRAAITRNMAESMERVNFRLMQLRIEGATNAQATAAIEEVLENEAWRMRRIVRTETAALYNAAQLDGVTALQAHFPDIRSRWVEHVSDSTWEPLDAKVAPDSIALHGQVAQVGGVFTMPNDRSVAESMWGKTWAFPPNRPNDRAVIAPWRKAWGVPAWTFTGGGRRWLVRR